MVLKNRYIKLIFFFGAPNDVNAFNMKTNALNLKKKKKKTPKRVNNNKKEKERNKG